MNLDHLPKPSFHLISKIWTVNTIKSKQWLALRTEKFLELGLDRIMGSYQQTWWHSDCSVAEGLSLHPKKENEDEFFMSYHPIRPVWATPELAFTLFYSVSAPCECQAGTRVLLLLPQNQQHEWGAHWFMVPTQKLCEALGEAGAAGFSGRHC